MKARWHSSPVPPAVSARKLRTFTPRPLVWHLAVPERVHQLIIENFGVGAGSLEDSDVKLTYQPVPEMRADLLALFERGEMSKYLSEEEMATYDEAVAAGKAGVA